jgi:hypothetical protein
MMHRRTDLFLEVFGERGRHARSAVGMSSLLGGIPVEIEVIGLAQALWLRRASNFGEVRSVCSTTQ